MAAIMAGLLLGAGIAQAGEYETPSVPLLKLAIEDGVQVFTAPVRWDGRDWLVAGGSVLGVYVASTLDAPARNWMARQSDGSVDRVADYVQELGSWGAIGLMGGIYLGGTMAGKPEIQRMAWDAAIASFIAGGIITPAMKYAVGRARPRQDLGAYHFDPFGGDLSFPSGHTTQAFALASVIAESCGSPWVSAISYVLAGTVGISRMYHRAHFLSDVTAGAVIGTATGVCVVRYNKQKRPPVIIAPTSINGIPGVVWAGGW